MRAFAKFGGLFLLPLLPFYQLAWHPFCNLDDSSYVLNNLMAKAGLSARTVEWAFLNPYYGHWSPLTLLSHNLDYHLFGLWAGGHHYMSLLFHMLSVVMLFKMLSALTSNRVCSALTSAIFAVHPLVVEPVSWVSSRKDVLSCLFGIAAVWTYAVYARQPGLWRYVLTLVCFCMGLMCKSALIGLPGLFLVLDYWPLQRYGCRTDGSIARCLWEKIPFFLLSAAVLVITVVAQQSMGALDAYEPLPWATRFGNAAVFYLLHLGRVIFPIRLAFPYPVQSFSPLIQVLAMASILIITASAWMLRRARPAFFLGWMWFIIMLIPFVQFVQVALQPVADRWAYFPMIGPIFFLAWCLADLLRFKPRFTATLVTVILSVLAVCSWLQTRYWESNITLFRHAVQVTPPNFAAEIYLAGAHLQNKELDEALNAYRQALAIANRPDVFSGLVKILERLGRSSEALEYYHPPLSGPISTFSLQQAASFLLSIAAVPKLKRSYKESLGKDPLDEAEAISTRALTTAPHAAETLHLLALVRLKKGRLDEAASLLQQTVALRPYCWACFNNLASVYFARGEFEAAEGAIDKASIFGPAELESYLNRARIRLKLDDADGAMALLSRAMVDFDPSADLLNLYGRAYLMKGVPQEALPLFKKAASLNKESKSAYNGWGVSLFQLAQPREAVEKFERALEIEPDDAEINVNFAGALVQLGEFDRAKEALKRALDLDPENKMGNLLMRAFGG